MDAHILGSQRAGEETSMKDKANILILKHKNDDKSTTKFGLKLNCSRVLHHLQDSPP